MKEIGSEKVLNTARSTEGGVGSKDIWAMPICKQHISKRGFPYHVTSFIIYRFVGQCLLCFFT